MFYCPGNGQQGLPLWANIPGPYLKTAFANYISLLKVTGMVKGPCMICHSWAFGRCFNISNVFFSSSVKSSACFAGITHRTIRTRNFENTVTCAISGEGNFGARNSCCRVHRFIYNWDMILFLVCVSEAQLNPNVRKRRERLRPWLRRFN